MTKRFPLRRAGAAALGAALIGFGVARSDLIDWDQEPDPPPDPKPEVPQNPRKLVLPQPKFGWPVGQKVQDPAKEVREALGAAARERRNRAELLASASDRALISPPVPVARTPTEETIGEPETTLLPDNVAPGAEPPTGQSAATDQLALLGDPLPVPTFGLALPSESGSGADDMPAESKAALEGGSSAIAVSEAPVPEGNALSALPPPVTSTTSDAVEASPVAIAQSVDPSAAEVLAQVSSSDPPSFTATREEADKTGTPPAGADQALAPATAPLSDSPAGEAEPFTDFAAPTDPVLAEREPEPVHLAANTTGTGAARPQSTQADSFLSGAAAKPRSPATSGTVPTAPSAPAVRPAPPLAELVPDRSDARQRLALATAIPSTSSPGTMGSFNSSTPPDLDPAAALARANERSLLNFAPGPPAFTYDDELILDIQVKGADASDTVIAYGTREGIFLPFGSLARILDLAVAVSDEGHYASGWTLDEDRTLTLDLRNNVAIVQGKEEPLSRNTAAAFDGELYLRWDMFRRFLPLDIQVDLRMQKIVLETLEPFPFQEKAGRDARRARLASRQAQEDLRWPRDETPWRLFSTPLVDLEMRALSDSARGERMEGDVRMAGDLGYLTAEALLSADTRDGLTTSLITLGRTDPDAELLGPIQATNFSFGDVSTVSMPIGLRGIAGRGMTLTNVPPESASVFENIDLRGILPDGYEVELYRNDVLIGSTAEAINGQYEFLQVPVDFGLNVLRLVFYGPQGQRSEQVRRITVGDGRLAQGKLVYRFGAAQKDENLLGVRDPLYFPPDDFGAWRLTGELAYGLTSDITAIASGAWFETPIEDKWLFSSGIRTGIGRFAVRSDLSLGDGGAWAVGGGFGGRFGDSTFTIDHTEYSGDFVDETKTTGREFLERATELDFNTTLNLGNPVSGLTIPVAARLRRTESQAGRTQTTASVRASTRISSVLASNTIEYSRTSFPQLNALSQLFGNFDLSTLGRSKLRGRVSLGYQVLPSPDLVSTSLEVGYLPDEHTSLRARLGYDFQGNSAQFGASAVREFDNFTLSLDGNYGFSDKNHSVGLRFATSFGRNPQNGRFFMARPGLASMGAASMRAFQDMDGDGIYGPVDRVLPDVDFVAFNQTATTDSEGVALLGGLGNGQRVNLQVDRSTLPDIAFAPAVGGVEIVPRPGRIHKGDFAIVALSEIEGQVDFAHGNGMRGVSGVRLELRNKSGEVVSHTRSEMDGYYFFEEVKPGRYEIVLDGEQAEKLKLCLAEPHFVEIGYESDIHQEPILVESCD